MTYIKTKDTALLFTAEATYTHALSYAVPLLLPMMPSLPQVYPSPNPLKQTVRNMGAEPSVNQDLCISLFIYLGFKLAFNTLYRSYHNVKFYVQMKPVQTAGQGSVL